MFIANNICTSVFLMKISRSRAVVNLKARLRGSVVFEFGACWIWIVKDVKRGSFLFPTYLGRPKETLFAGYLSVGGEKWQMKLMKKPKMFINTDTSYWVYHLHLTDK